MKQDTNGSIESKVAAEGHDLEVESLRSGPLKKSISAPPSHIWILEKEGALAKSTIESCKKVLSWFVADWECPRLDPLFIRQYALKFERFHKLSVAATHASFLAATTACGF